jgi:hypothetical protein
MLLMTFRGIGKNVCLALLPEAVVDNLITLYKCIIRRGWTKRGCTVGMLLPLLETITP